MKLRYVFLLLLPMLIAGCQNSSLNRNLDEEQKIYIHETTKNYGGLIELYKNQLKRNDTEQTRVKLARVYYLSIDYDSARQILRPVVPITKDDEVLVLYSRILYKLGKYEDSLNNLGKALELNVKNGEAYNLRGILQVRLGQYDAAYHSFNQSRQMFYDENKVINNLAMLSILDKDYNAAYNHLNILYRKGYRNSALLYNLLYTLVKLDKITLANQFCIEHKLSDRPVILIQELKNIDPNKTVRFTKIVPSLSEMQEKYDSEIDDKVPVSSNFNTIPTSEVKGIQQNLSSRKQYSYANNTISEKQHEENSSVKTSTTNIQIIQPKQEQPIYDDMNKKTNNPLISNNLYRLDATKFSAEEKTEKVVRDANISNRNFIHAIGAM